ncbi:MAG: nitroreductase [Bacteroidales bacterium]|nr:nitroreductase [Bacteroidales bacterium]
MKDAVSMLELMKARHSVRSFTEEKPSNELISRLNEEIKLCNKEGNLNFQLVLDEPSAFSSALAHYGKFSGVRNYIACVGKKSDNLQERVGFYGERLVLLLQFLSLNSCWVALTFKKVQGAFTVASDEKLVCVICFGYGTTQGSAHKTKKFEQVCKVANPSEELRQCVEAALLAPTSLNQQKFSIFLNAEGKPEVKRSGIGIYTKVDLGIVRYHLATALKSSLDVMPLNNGKFF